MSSEDDTVGCKRRQCVEKIKLKRRMEIRFWLVDQHIGRPSGGAERENDNELRYTRTQVFKWIDLVSDFDEQSPIVRGSADLEARQIEDPFEFALNAYSGSSGILRASGLEVVPLR